MTSNSKRNDQGFVIVIALLALLIMSFFLITGTATTTTSIKISGNYNKSVDAFNIAEAGLNRARPMLENVSFSGILANYSSTYLINTTAFNNGTYKVTVTNDEKDGVSNLTDTNSIIKVISKGISSSGATSTITTYLQSIGATNPVNLPPGPPGGDSAAVVCGSGVDVSTHGSSTLDGDNYTDPVLPCHGSGCNGSHISNNPYDIIAETSLNSCTGCGGVTTQSNAGSALNCSSWRTLNNQLSAMNSSNPNVVVLTGTGTTYQNDCNTPKVFIISTSSPTFTMDGNNGLCGVIVVASDTIIQTHGTVTIEGIMLFMGGNSATAGIAFDPSGTTNFYGKMIFGSSSESNSKTIDLGGTSTLEFSSAAVASAQQAINNVNSSNGGGSTSAQLLTVGWEESY